MQEPPPPFPPLALRNSRQTKGCVRCTAGPDVELLCSKPLCLSASNMEVHMNLIHMHDKAGSMSDLAAPSWQRQRRAAWPASAGGSPPGCQGGMCRCPGPHCSWLPGAPVHLLHAMQPAQRLPARHPAAGVACSLGEGPVKHQHGSKVTLCC